MENEDLLEPKKPRSKRGVNNLPTKPKPKVTLKPTVPKRDSPGITLKEPKAAKRTKKAVVFDIQGKLVHIKVGDTQKPSTNQDIEDIQGKIEALLESHNIQCMVFVTHHAVEMKVIG